MKSIIKKQIPKTQGKGKSGNVTLAYQLGHW